jgi:hypothetical protein
VVGEERYFKSREEIFFLLIRYLLDDASSPYGKSTVYNAATMESQSNLSYTINIDSLCLQ